MIRYQPIYTPQRRSKKLRLTGHSWYCDVCGELVHDEPRLEIDEDVEAQAARVERIKLLTESHVCPKKRTA